MNNHQIRAITAGFVAALVLTALLLLVKWRALTFVAYLFALLGVVEFFGTVVYVAGSSRRSYLTNAAFPLAAKSYGIFSILFSIAAAALQQCDVWTMPVGWFIFVHILLAALLIWLFLAMRSGQEEVERVERQVEAGTLSWRSMWSEAVAVWYRADETSRKDVGAVCEAFRYADPVESPALAGLDGEIMENLNRLGQLVDAKDAGKIADLCVTLQRQIKERGVRLKMLK